MGLPQVIGGEFAWWVLPAAACIALFTPVIAFGLEMLALRRMTHNGLSHSAWQVCSPRARSLSSASRSDSTSRKRTPATGVFPFVARANASAAFWSKTRNDAASEPGTAAAISADMSAHSAL